MIWFFEIAAVGQFLSDSFGKSAINQFVSRAAQGINHPAGRLRRRPAAPRPTPPYHPAHPQGGRSRARGYLPVGQTGQGLKKFDAESGKISDAEMGLGEGRL